MIDVAQQHKRVVQVGTQQRSGRALPAGPRADPRRAHRQGRLGAHARATGTSCPASATRPTATARRTRLGPVARPGPAAAVQPEPRPLSLPLVLGLLRRADDQPWGTSARHRRLGTRAQTPEAVIEHRRAVRADRQRRDARHAGRAVRLRPLDGRVHTAASVRLARSRRTAWNSSAPTVHLASAALDSS